MAERRPVVLDDDGNLVEIPDTDNIAPTVINKDVDGGSAASVYLSGQSVDGGSASG